MGFPQNLTISTHAPRTGSDVAGATSPDTTTGFQPTLPARGATREIIIDAADMRISTHAPRTGSDPRGGDERGGGMAFQPTLPARGATLTDAGKGRKRPHFNPRSPHGERPRVRLLMDAGSGISTHAPRTGSDVQTAPNFQQRQRISTHAPRTGSDGRGTRPIYTTSEFQPTLPARGATAKPRIMRGNAEGFQPTLPARGATPFPLSPLCLI